MFKPLGRCLCEFLRSLVLAYNGTNFDFDSYEFLYQAALGNTSFNDQMYVQPTPSGKYRVFTSARVLETFKLDLDRFMVFCHLRGSPDNCMEDFQWNLHPEIGCYEPKIGLKNYGEFWSVTLTLFFDPNITMCRYVTQR